MKRQRRSAGKVPRNPPDGGSVSASHISGIASTGAYTTNVQAEHVTMLSTAVVRSALEVVPPPRLTNLPTRQHLFVGRDEALADVRAAFTSGNGVVIQAVHGLGGIGKSALAARYSADHSSDYSLVWWLTADTPSTINAGLAALAVALQPALSSVFSLEALQEWATAWLACHDGWLLVLDNVTNPGDIAPLTGRFQNGRFLITSRLATGWYDSASSVVRLDVLGLNDAVDLLTRIAPGATEGAEGAEELCVTLGCLPLAVEQAGAYMAETGINPQVYLALLADYPGTMFDSAATIGSGSRQTIAKIWRVTLDHLADDPLAGEILRILAWYASDPIPRTLLTGRVGTPDVQRAIGRLVAFSMITIRDDKTITVHRLVQAVARTPSPDDPNRAPNLVEEARKQATVLLALAVPPSWTDSADWPAWRTLLPHVEALANHAPADSDTAAMAWVFRGFGLFLSNQGAHRRAIALLERAYAAQRRVQGEDHPETLITQDSLACTYRDADVLDRAVPLHEQTVSDCIRVLGEDHPLTLRSRASLAYAYKKAGDLGRAIPLYEQAVASVTRVLGEDHPDTLGFCNNLANAYYEAGDLDRAIQLHERTFAKKIRVLGEDDPDTLSSCINLASAYNKAGNLRRATSLYEKGFNGFVRVWGEDHPHTLAARDHVAGAYQAAGNLDAAIALCEQSVTESVRLFGNDHPQTLRSRNNLASSYQEMGNLDRAIALFERVHLFKKYLISGCFGHAARLSRSMVSSS